MSRMPRYFLILRAMGAVWAFIACAGEMWAGDPQLKKVLDDWQKRQHRMETIEYQVIGEHIVPQGAYTALTQSLGKSPKNRVVPSEETRTPISFTLLLDFVKGRHREESKMATFALDSGKVSSNLGTVTFNGYLEKEFTPKEQNPERGPSQPELSITSGNIVAAFPCSAAYPIFFGHGRIVIAGTEEMTYGKLRNKPDPAHLYIHGTGVQDERKCLIVRTRTLKAGSGTTFQEYWVDATRESAIVRYIDYSDDKPRIEMTMHYRELIRGDESLGWFPDSWRWTLFQNEHTMYTEEVRVEKVRANPAVTDADFDLDVAKPGMIVEEITILPAKDPSSRPERRISVYRVKESGGIQEMPDPYRRQGDQYREHLHPWRLVFWICITMGILGILVWLKRRKRAT